MKRLMILGAGFALLVAANGALADLIAVGDPVEGGSWYQAFNESGIGKFDLVSMQMVSSGDSFESTSQIFSASSG